MKQTKKITFSAMSIALGVLFMTLGAFVEVLDLTASALCSCLMAFVFIEIGAKYAIAVWLGTTILGAVFYTHSLVWVTFFLIFGIFPILKAYIEKTKRPFWIPLKLAFFAISATVMILVSELLLGIPFFGDTSNMPLFEENTWLFKLLVYIFLVAALYVYDIFMTVMIRLYFTNIRKRIQSLLK
ncbi:MAG: hypothetical protein IJD79_06940 [Clostridia bacterium]|nr:hypothetical protein [Clostridia bacterium]